jgi:hypothetical protein
MPSKTESRTRKGVTVTTYTRLTPEQVKAEARKFADRTVRRARKGDAYPSDLWVTSYIRRWRQLSGLKARSVAGPVPVMLPATTADAARHARRRSA